MQHDYENDPEVPDAAKLLLKATNKIKSLEEQVASYRIEYDLLRRSAIDQIRESNWKRDEAIRLLDELVDFSWEKRFERVVESAVEFLRENKKTESKKHD